MKDMLKIIYDNHKTTQRHVKDNVWQSNKDMLKVRVSQTGFLVPQFFVFIDCTDFLRNLETIINNYEYAVKLQ